MDCQQFLSSYSEYRDGLVDDETSARVDAHLQGCPSCRRYERVVEEGVHQLRSLPPVTPGEDFIPRLKHRIFHIEDGDLAFHDPRGSGVTAVAAVGLTILLTAAAWSPVLRQAGATVELPAIVVSDPPPAVQVRAEPQLPRSAFFRSAESRSGAMFSSFSLSTATASSRVRAPVLMEATLLRQGPASRFEILGTATPSAATGEEVAIESTTPGLE